MARAPNSETHMALIEHWATDPSVLARTLARALSAGSADPFQRLAVAVPAMGVGHWLQQAFATELGAVANVDYVPARQAVDAALAALQAPQTVRGRRYWAADELASARWRPDALRFQIVGRLLAHSGAPDFQAVTAYLECGDADGPLEHRLLSFAGSVAGTLDALVYDRPAESLRWAADPTCAPDEHRWLAWLLADLGVATPDGPLCGWMDGALPTAPEGWPPLCVFGLVWLPPGLRARLEQLAERLDVHLYRVEPSPTRRQRLSDAPGLTSWLDASASDPPLPPSENRVLASLGEASVDTQAWLARVSAESHALPAASPAEGSLLQRLHGWVRAEGGQTQAAWPHDDSLRFHATYGPLRQVELLRDSLLALFNEADGAPGGAYDARDVLIATPDLTTFAPLVEAVFAQRGVAVRMEGAPAEDADDAEDGPAKKAQRETRLPALPVSITHLGLTQTNRVAEALLTVLRLSEERVTAPGLMELLSLGPVRERLGVSADQLGALQAMLADAGARWALDATDRRQAEQPELHVNTLRFGLERLALGALMPALDVPVEGHPDEPTLTAQPVAPLEQRSTEARALTAALLRAVRALEHLRGAARAGTLDAAGWRDWCDRALKALSQTSEQASWLTVQVNEALDQLVEDMVTGGLAGRPVALSAFRRLLQGRFEVAQAARRVITGAVTLCGLDTLRGVPHRIVALLGMDDGAFPRGGEAPGWDPRRDPRAGERDQRAVDRHLLLDLLMAAGDQVWIFWSGRDLARGKERPAAVPVEELMDTVCTLTGRTRAEVEQVAPRQPWSPAAFDRHKGPGVFDARLARATEAALGVAAGQAPAPVGLAASRDEQLPPEDAPPQVLPLARLASNLAEPQKMLLYERLGIWLPKPETSLPDREPIELDALEKSTVSRAALEAALASTPPGTTEALTDRVVARLSAEGLLPLQAGGRRVAREQVDAALKQRSAFEFMAGDPCEPDTLQLQVAGVQLSGRPERARVRDGELVFEWLSPSSGHNTKVPLTAWLHLLAARALKLPVRLARTVPKGTALSARPKRPPGFFLFSEATPEAALAALETLIRTWQAARRQALPLFQKTSPKLGRYLARRTPDKPVSLAALRGEAGRGWEYAPDYNSYGDAGDRWVQAFFADFHPHQVMETEDQIQPLPADGLLGLADTIWGPLYAAEVEGEKRAADWLPT